MQDFLEQVDEIPFKIVNRNLRAKGGLIPINSKAENDVFSSLKNSMS